MKGNGPKVLFVCGVAGVGKTYMINRVIRSFPAAVTCRASSIIQEARKIADPDTLRRLSMNDIALSQELLIAGLNRVRTECAAALVVLDGHSVIDTENGYFDITVETVKRLHVHSVVHLEEAVERVQKRRALDSTRGRLSRSIDELAEYQSRSLAMCQSYERELSIPLVRLCAGDEPALRDVVSRMMSDG